jgi:hypothetical protein
MLDHDIAERVLAQVAEISDQSPVESDEQRLAVMLGSWMSKICSPEDGQSSLATSGRTKHSDMAQSRQIQYVALVTDGGGQGHLILQQAAYSIA